MSSNTLFIEFFTCLSFCIEMIWELTLGELIISSSAKISLYVKKGNSNQ
jgi:hypothetical protein